MVIWLRNSHAFGGSAVSDVGVDGDILRADALAVVIDIDRAFEESKGQCAVLLREASAQAEALVEAARVEAQALLTHAETQYREGRQRGYDEAWSEVMQQVHERRLRQRADAAEMGRKERARLAEIVALGVEQIVGGADAQARLRQAARAVDGIVSEGSPLKVCVHPDDLAAASAAFEAAAREWRDAGRAVRLQVSADAQVLPGHCVCETDLGAIDLSLSLQLDSLGAALAAALTAAQVDAQLDDRVVPDACNDLADACAADDQLAPACETEEIAQ